jgi:hypothetical protein
MKFWLVLYVAGQVGGSWGPLPYDVAECIERKKPLEQEIAYIVEHGKNQVGEAVGEPHLSRFKQMRFECELRAERPEIEVD